MRIVKTLILIIIFNNYSLLFSQSNPIKIDLISNENKLDAIFLQTNKNNPVPAVVLLHGFPGNQSSPLGLAEKLNAAGFNILVFNYQGSYASEGNFSFENCIADVRTAFAFLKTPENLVKFKIDTSKIFICGYSFGGSIALESAIHDIKIRNIISISNDDHSVAIKKTATDLDFRNDYEQFVSKSFGPDGPFRGNIKAVLDSNIENVDNFDLVKNANTIKDRNILFIVGWLDTGCPLEVTALPLYRKLKQLKAENISLKGFDSDHSFSNVRDDLANTIIDWINKQNAF